MMINEERSYQSSPCQLIGGFSQATQRFRLDLHDAGYGDDRQIRNEVDEIFSELSMKIQLSIELD